MHVPDSPAGLDVDWLQQALACVADFDGTRLIGVEARVIGVGYGLVGTLARLALDFEGGGPHVPSSLVAKLSSLPRAQGEVTFYEQIAPHVPVRLPRYYFGAASPADGRAVLLLEDLTAAEQGDCIAGAPRPRAEALLRATARFHAAFLGDGGTHLDALGPWAPRAGRLAGQLEERLPRFRARYAGRVAPRALARIEELPRRLPELARVLEACERTLVHTDLHLDNVLFLDDGEPVILDWTDARSGPPLLDVARIFVEGVSLATRRAHGGALLEVYRRARADAGAPCPAREEVDRLYAAAVLYQLAHAVAWAGREHPGSDAPRVQRIVDSLLANTTAAAIDIPVR